MIEITNSIFREASVDISYQESRDMISRWIDSFKGIEDVLRKPAQEFLSYGVIERPREYIRSEFIDEVKKEFRENLDEAAVDHECIIFTAELLAIYCQGYSDMIMEYGSPVTTRSEYKIARARTEKCEKYYRGLFNAAFDMLTVRANARSGLGLGMSKEEVKYVEEIKSKIDALEKSAKKFTLELLRMIIKIRDAEESGN